MTTARDHLVVDFEPIPIIERAARFSESEETDADLCAELGIPMKKGWNIARARYLLQKEDDLGDLIEPVLYRPFDVRLIFYHDSLVWRTVKKVMRHMLAGENLGLVTTRQCQNSWGAMVTNTIIAHKALAAYDINSLFPLYTFPQEALANTVNPRKPNLDAKFTRSFASAVGLDFIPDGAGDLTSTFGPKDIFRYLYAILHSPEYRRRYADFLKSDFPRVPLPAHRAVFSALITPGARLVSLHLMEADDRRITPAFPRTGSNQVDQVRYMPPSSGLPGRVWINRKQYFESVEPEIWASTIGGYRPAEKWLKDRKGRTLSEDDIDHYQQIVLALSETSQLMREIDKIIEEHGDWPEAFQTDKAPNPVTMSTRRRGAAGIV